MTGDDDVDLSDCIGAGTRTVTILTISLVPETKSVGGTSKILFLKSDEWCIDMTVLHMRQHSSYLEERMRRDCRATSLICSAVVGGRTLINLPLLRCHCHLDLYQTVSKQEKRRKIKSNAAQITYI